ncbi:hypothetical protein [Cellulomonas sp. NS3]|uniref:hypothetical protein n=1 Tax=Cellulomonas sp. NS3 TaxID=2973977 RepID=UPI00216182E4|nr:hypothetical protein [Cellulomonas sp. NS3]
MTREPETDDGTATPAARGLPDDLDLLAEPLRTPVRERDGRAEAVPPPGTAVTASRHEPGAGTSTGRTVGEASDRGVREPRPPAVTDGGVQTDRAPSRGDAPTGGETLTTRAGGPSTPQGRTGETAADAHPGAAAPTDRAPGVAGPTVGATGADRPAPEVGVDRRQNPPGGTATPHPDAAATRVLPPVSTAPAPGPDDRPGTPAPVHHGGGSHAGARPGAWTPPPHVAPEVVPARHRRQPWAVIVLAMLFALTLALATYLVVLTRAHEERAAEWEQVARTTGTELAQQRVELDGAIAELEAVRAQLQTAQARITELADEKAQIGDEREAQRQLVDYQARVSDAAGKVAGALDVCVDGQYQLISYLENAAAYDAADLARFRTDVQQVCGAARDANAALQLELER